MVYNIWVLTVYIQNFELLQIIKKYETGVFFFLPVYIYFMNVSLFFYEKASVQFYLKGTCTVNLILI